MYVYRIIPDSDRFNCLQARSKDQYKLDQLVGKPIASAWKPITAELDDTAGRSGDFPSLLGGVPVFSETAWLVLEPLIRSSAEALPINSSDGAYYIIHVLDIVDCLDHDRSKIVRLPSGGVMDVEKYVFKEGCLKDKHIFRLPETIPQQFVQVSETFRELVKKNELQGLIFRRLAKVD